MIDLEKLETLVSEGAVDTVIAAFPDLYGRLLGKRFTGHFFLEEIATGSLHVCDYLLACDMEMDTVAGYDFTSWDKGYGDVRPVPDLSTLRVATWLDRTALVICDLHEEESDAPIEVSPRRILQRQVDRAAALGLTPFGATELELYLFNDSYEDAAKKNYTDLETMGSYIEDYHILQGTKEESLVAEIRRHLDRSGVPVESSKGEWGPGQQEIGLRYDQLVEMADRHVIYKTAAKEIAWRQGRSVTFMAKWDERYAGSSCHLHLSLRDSDGRALFAGSEETGGIHHSETFRHFLGGWMKRIGETFPFYAPYPSSYKRYVAGSFAPTGVAWSADNRTAGFRIVGEGDALRIECRAPGADANPYLAFAAALAAGLEGIENAIDPPPPFEGDVYGAQELPQVPHTLHEAIGRFAKSDWARTTFGEEVMEHYLHFFRTEQRKFDEAVTDWERKRYFERA
jgi:glutamine synthetase